MVGGALLLVMVVAVEEGQQATLREATVRS
jgi:hypothetical protein